MYLDYGGACVEDLVREGGLAANDVGVGGSVMAGHDKA